MPAVYSIFAFDSCLVDEKIDLFECRECGRKLKKDSYFKHRNKCNVVFFKKRTVYEISNHRMKRELEYYATSTPLPLELFLDSPLMSKSRIPASTSINSVEFWIQWHRQELIGNLTFQATWLRHNVSVDKKQITAFALQSSYNASFGQCDPRLSLNGNRGAQKHASRSKLIETTSLPGDIIPNVIASSSTAESASRMAVELSNEGGKSSCSNKSNKVPDHVLLRGFGFSGKKFNKLLSRVKETRSITLFISSPFDGCEDERKHFMEFR